MLRGVAFAACVVLAACDGAQTPEVETDGTLDVVFSAPTGEPNMDLSAFAATEAHGKFYAGRTCTGIFSKTCQSWKAVSFTTYDDADRKVYVRVELSEVQAGFTRQLSHAGYATLTVDDIAEERTESLLTHRWGAKSGTFVIDAVDGDLVTFRVVAAIVEPVVSPTEDHTVGTFVVDATGVILIHREI